jgi:hypothetical protein
MRGKQEMGLACENESTQINKAQNLRKRAGTALCAKKIEWNNYLHVLKSKLSLVPFS